MLDRALSYHSISRNDLHITNSILCRPPHDLDPAEWRRALDCCKPRLKRELAGNRWILAVGLRALQTTTGKAKIMPWVGAPLRDLTGYRWVLPTFHPAFVLRDKGAYQGVFYEFVGRAWGLATGALGPWKAPYHKIVRPGRAMLTALRMLRDAPDLGVDTETWGDDAATATIMCIGVAHGKLAVSAPWHRYEAGKKWGLSRGITEYPLGREIEAELKALLSNSRIKKTFQNGRFDISIFEAQGIELVNYDYDTMSAHAVGAPQLAHDLGFIMACESHAPRHKTIFGEYADAKGAQKDKGLRTFVHRDPRVLRDYNADDAWVQWWLKNPTWQRVLEAHQGPELFQRYMDLGRECALKMRRRGMTVSQEHRARHEATLTVRRGDSDRDVRRIAETFGLPDFNPNSPKQVTALFFKMGVQPLDYTDEGAPSWDEDVLKKLVAGTHTAGAMFSRSLLNYRRWTKLLETYVEPLPRWVGARIYPDWKPEGARTGRWSCSPNMQNLPQPKWEVQPDGSKILISAGMRDLYCARDGLWLVGADYDQLELKIIAQLSGSRYLLDLYGRGVDVHRETAKRFRNTDNPGKAERDLAKSFEYAANYKGKKETIWENLVVDFPSLTLKTVGEMMDIWLGQLNPEIVGWQERTIYQAKTKRFVEFPISGRRLYFYGRVKPTEVCNYPVQGTAADLMDPAAIRIAQQLDWNTEGLYAQIHDELTTEGPDPVKLARLLKQEMEQEVEINGIKMRYTVTLKVGRNLGEMKECKGGVEEVAAYAAASV